MHDLGQLILRRQTGIHLKIKLQTQKLNWMKFCEVSVDWKIFHCAEEAIRTKDCVLSEPSQHHHTKMWLKTKCASFFFTQCNWNLSQFLRKLNSWDSLSQSQSESVSNMLYLLYFLLWCCKTDKEREKERQRDRQPSSKKETEKNV